MFPFVEIIAAFTRRLPAPGSWLLGLVFVSVCLQVQAQQPSLVVNLIAPVTSPGGARELSLDRYPRFYVQLINIGKDPLHLWKDWNSWGWFNLSFVLKTREGSSNVTRISSGHWEGDFPDFWTLPPNESLILEVDMSSGEWKGFPDLYGEKQKATLTAIYENKPDPLAEAYSVWVGRLVSNPVDVIFK